jgi:hypothetical protein
MFKHGESLDEDRRVTPGTTTKLALGVATLELGGTVAEYVASGKVDGVLLGLTVLTLVAAGVSEFQGRVASSMAQDREDMDQALDRIRELRAPSE